MNRPKTKTLPRPRTISARVAKSSKDAAIELVRLEFDSERLRLGIEQALGRAQGLQAELAQNKEKRTRLIGLLVPQEQQR